MNNPVIPYYLDKISQLEAMLGILQKRDGRYALLRLITAILGVAIAILSFQQSIILGIIILGALGIAFFIIFIKHESIKEQIIEKEVLIAINRNEISCLENHSNEYNNGSHNIDSNHPYSHDLDVFGPHSIYGLINRCRTYYGNRFLATYLSKPGSISAIANRRASVKELTPIIEWRHTLHALIYNLEDESDHNFSESLMNQLNNDFSIFDGRKWRTIIQLLPIVWILILGLWILRIPFADTAALILGVAIFGIYYFNIKRINEIQFKISKGNELLGVYGKAFQLIYDTKYQNQHLRHLTQKDKAKDNDIQAMFQLKKIMDKLDYRLNMIAGIILNFGLLWDLRMIRELSIWKSKHYDNIAQLFIVLGKIEAKSSLANWAYNHPEYCHASIDSKHLHIEASEVFHPLMKKGECVPNDFILTENDLINIVTGSNMSGKSTFLRTLGTNMVLAYAGTVSAAKELIISHAKIVTYMRIKDALEENVSTFKAELDRVKMILTSIENKEQCLFLIDEMLRGTNSRDKLKGSIAITRKLLESKAYAIIATHDIKLAELGERYPANIKNYYFDIEFHDEDLTFDYKIKEGICSNFNASYLLQKIGIK